MVGCLLRAHAGIDEANKVRERMVAEKQMHLRAVALVAIHAVQALGVTLLELAIGVAVKVSAGGTAEHPFIGGHPMQTHIGGNLEHFFRNAAFRRPGTAWAHAKDLLLQLDAASQLLASVLSMLEALRQLDARA